MPTTTITNVCVSTVFLCYDQRVRRHYTIHMTVSPSALSLSFRFRCFHYSAALRSNTSVVL
jgi:hypothetical protein